MGNIVKFLLGWFILTAILGGLLGVLLHDQQAGLLIAFCVSPFTIWLTLKMYKRRV